MDSGIFTVLGVALFNPQTHGMHAAALPSPVQELLLCFSLLLTMEMLPALGPSPRQTLRITMFCVSSGIRIFSFDIAI